MATVSRFTGLPNKDNTDRIITNDYQAPAFAATIALSISKSKTIVKPAVLTGAVTFTANVVAPLTGLAADGPFVGDSIEFYFTPDGTSRVVTFGTGFLPTATLSVTTAKFAVIVFKFNGTAWLEVSRAVSA